MKINELYTYFEQATGVSIDSRACPKGSLFFAMKGDNFNGNKFALSALENGASYAVVDEAEYALDERFLLFDNALVAMQDLARFHRVKIATPIVGITGTNGKTTTKELMASVLQRKYQLLYTQGNFNNHIGVPLTLLSLKKEHDLAVVEMGANHPGEIKALCEIALPDYGIITNLGKAHLEGFGSFEGVKKTKKELYDFLRLSMGTVFLHADSPYLPSMAGGLKCITYGESIENYVSANLLSASPFLSITACINESQVQINSHLIGAYNITNLLAAICVGKFFNVDEKEIVLGLSAYEPNDNRSQLLQTANNTLVLDTYNANPTSMEASLLNFEQMQLDCKALILADMLELGPDSRKEHQAIVDLIKKLGFSEVYLVGKEFNSIAHPYQQYESVEELKAYFSALEPQNRCFLIKGSNSMKLSTLTTVL